MAGITDFKFLSESTAGKPIAIGTSATTVHVVSGTQRVLLKVANTIAADSLENVTVTIFGTQYSITPVVADDGDIEILDSTFDDTDVSSQDIEVTASSASALAVIGKVWDIG